MEFRKSFKKAFYTKKEYEGTYKYEGKELKNGDIVNEDDFHIQKWVLHGFLRLDGIKKDKKENKEEKENKNFKLKKDNPPINSFNEKIEKKL